MQKVSADSDEPIFESVWLTLFCGMLIISIFFLNGERPSRKPATIPSISFRGSEKVNQYLNLEPCKFTNTSRNSFQLWRGTSVLKIYAYVVIWHIIPNTSIFKIFALERFYNIVNGKAFIWECSRVLLSFVAGFHVRISQNNAKESNILRAICNTLHILCSMLHTPLRPSITRKCSHTHELQAFKLLYCRLSQVSTQIFKMYEIQNHGLSRIPSCGHIRTCTARGVLHIRCTTYRKWESCTRSKVTIDLHKV